MSSRPPRRTAVAKKKAPVIELSDDAESNLSTPEEGPESEFNSPAPQPVKAKATARSRGSTVNTPGSSTRRRGMRKQSARSTATQEEVTVQEEEPVVVTTPASRSVSKGKRTRESPEEGDGSGRRPARRARRAPPPTPKRGTPVGRVVVELDEEEGAGDDVEIVEVVDKGKQVEKGRKVTRGKRAKKVVELDGVDEDAGDTVVEAETPKGVAKKQVAEPAADVVEVEEVQKVVKPTPTSRKRPATTKPGAKPQLKTADAVPSTRQTRRSTPGINARAAITPVSATTRRSLPEGSPRPKTNMVEGTPSTFSTPARPALGSPSVPPSTQQTKAANIRRSVTPMQVDRAATMSPEEEEQDVPTQLLELPPPIPEVSTTAEETVAEETAAEELPPPAQASIVAEELPPSAQVPLPMSQMLTLTQSVEPRQSQPPLEPESTEPKSRIVITHLVMTNFKSYAGKQEVGPFHPVSSPIAQASYAEAIV